MDKRNTKMNGDLLKNGTIYKALRVAPLTVIVLALIYAGYLLISNHLDHNTEALIRLEASINQSNEVDKEQIEVMRDLKTLIQTKLK